MVRSPGGGERVPCSRPRKDMYGSRVRSTGRTAGLLAFPRFRLPRIPVPGAAHFAEAERSDVVWSAVEAFLMRCGAPIHPRTFAPIRGQVVPFSGS